MRTRPTNVSNGYSSRKAVCYCRRVDHCNSVLENAVILKRLERELPVERVGESLWRDLRTSEDLGPLEIAERFGIDLDSEDRRSPQLDELLNHLRPNVSHLIGAQRLLSAPRHFRPHRRSWQPLRPGDEQPSEPTVVSYARDLTEKLEAALADNSRTSQRLDRSFPRRLFDQADPDVHTEEEIREMFEEQLEIRQRLAEISILDTSHELLTLPLDQLVEWQRKVLSIYLSDASEKLDTFDKLLRTIEPLRDIINKRFLLKRLEIDRDTGFAFYDDVTGKRVQLHHLSSGEQHELVLLYDLLMKVDPSSLVLLDEPEISLHVAWQKAFLDDLERVADLANLRFYRRYTLATDNRKSSRPSASAWWIPLGLMLEYLDPEDFVAELVMHRGASPSSAFVVVEGPSDYRALASAINGDCVVVFVAGDKERLMRALELIEPLDSLVIGIADRDFDNWSGRSVTQNVLLTEYYDRETDLLLRAGLLTDYVERSLDETKALEADAALSVDSVVNWIVELSASIGRVRWVSVRDNLKIRLSDFPVGAVVTDPFETDDVAIQRMALTRSTLARTSPPDLKSKVDALDASADPRDYCNGHDLIRTVAVTSESWADHQLGREEFENFLEKSSRRQIIRS